MRAHKLKKIGTSPSALISGLIGIIILSIIMWSFTDLMLIEGNQGTTRMYIEIACNIIFPILFGLIIAATTYKRNYMKNFDVKQSSSGLVGTLLGTIVAGCPACTITLASYLGLASLVALLPGGGIELKIIGLGLMVRSAYDTIKNLEQCKIKNRK